jgi:hypothetical protein
MTTNQVTYCAGRGCNNVATEVLKVAVLNLTGDFCQKCAASLVADGLAQFYVMEEKIARLALTSKGGNFEGDNTTTAVQNRGGGH